MDPIQPGSQPDPFHHVSPGEYTHPIPPASENTGSLYPGYVPPSDPNTLPPVGPPVPPPGYPAGYSAPPPTYGMPYMPVYPMAAYPQPQQSGFAIAGLVLSIIAIPLLFVYGFGIVCAILGIIFGHVAYGQQRSSGQPTGMAVASFVTGYIALGLGILCVVSAFYGFALIMNQLPNLLTPTPTPAGSF
jgi:hypothetical protein